MNYESVWRTGKSHPKRNRKNAKTTCKSIERTMFDLVRMVKRSQRAAYAGYRGYRKLIRRIHRFFVGFKRIRLIYIIIFDSGKNRKRRAVFGLFFCFFRLLYKYPRDIHPLSVVDNFRIFCEKNKRLWINCVFLPFRPHFCKKFSLFPQTIHRFLIL